MFTATDPTTGQVIREVPTIGADELEVILQRAADAHAVWRERSFDQRAEVIRTVAQRMRDDRERFALLMTEEMGKPITEGRGEVDKGAWALEHYADNAADYLATQEITSDATRSYVQYLPLGTVLGVLPWNAPIWLAFRYAAPALMAGNSCVMKHDSHVPGCAQAIADLFVDLPGAPDGLLQNLVAGHDVVEQAIRDPRIHAVSLTGSERAGAKVASIAASEIKPSVLELGGSDPAIVLADADLELAADNITTMRIINAGQSCIAAKRVIVERPVYDEFVAMFEKRLAALVMGDPREESTQVGPIARADLREDLHRQVVESVEQGATLRLGGQIPDGDGFFYPVTLLTDVESSMTACSEETFGPIAAVGVVDSVEEALAAANTSQYGLGASVFTSPDRGEAMARQIIAGQVAVNGIVKTDPRLPSGGVKRSGYGRELGPHGIQEFVNVQQVWIGPKQS